MRDADGTSDDEKFDGLASKAELGKLGQSPDLRVYQGVDARAVGQATLLGALPQLASEWPAQLFGRDSVQCRYLFYRIEVAKVAVVLDPPVSVWAADGEDLLGKIKEAVAVALGCSDETVVPFGLELDGEQAALLLEILRRSETTPGPDVERPIVDG